jgi:histone H3/H4
MTHTKPKTGDHTSGRNIHVAAKQARVQIATKQVRKRLTEKAVRKSGSASASEEDKRPHRYRPGTRALINIRKCQKMSGEGFLKRAHVRDIISYVLATRTDPGGHMRVTENARDMIQQLAESDTIRVLKSANIMNLSHNKQTLSANDIRVALNARTIMAS